MQRWSKLRWFTRTRIRRPLGAHKLTCGCSVGVYELYDGTTLTVIDAPALGCGHHNHAYGVLVDRLTQAHSSS